MSERRRPARSRSAADGLYVEVTDFVARITLDRPQRRNALTVEMMRRLVSLFEELDAHDTVRVIAVTGTGTDAFCSGIDLKESGERADAGLPAYVPGRGGEPSPFETLLGLSTPTVAVLNGPAVGGGCELALACDLRVASTHASLSLPEARRGLGAPFASVVLPLLVPRAVALRMLYTGEPMSSAEARQWGLVNEVVASEELASSAAALLDQIAGNAPLTLQRIKRVTHQGWSLPIRQALELDPGPDVYASLDRIEGMSAYLEKRPPIWVGA